MEHYTWEEMEMEKMSELIGRKIISGEKAKRELGWNPSRASIIDELRAYVLAVA